MQGLSFARTLLPKAIFNPAHAQQKKSFCTGWQARANGLKRELYITM
jgi:hypothetical protein